MARTPRAFIFGTNQDDILDGTSLSDRVFGYAGDDLIFSEGGDDRIVAGRGNDVLIGGTGNDNLIGGSGFDTAIYAGGIDDYAIREMSGGRIRIRDLTGDEGRDTLRGVEAIYFDTDGYTLYLDGTNNAVLAGDDSVATGENAPLAIDVATLLSNDREFDGDTIDITAVSATAASGAAVTLSGGTVSYDPGDLFDYLAEGETVTDTFTYTVDDGNGGTDTATVTVTITGTNDDPELVADTAVTIDENTTDIPASIAATDVDSDTLAFSITGGDDALFFAIDPETGTLSFVVAPDFETPLDLDGDNIYEVTVTVSDGDGGSASETISVTVADVTETPVIAPRINEIHYDNDGGDVGEFVEIRTAAGADITGMLLEFYNGSNSAVYDTEAVEAADFASSDGTYDYYVVEVSGIQNGSPDGIALSQDGTLIEFLSYEGTLTGSGGAADGVLSTDIGVSEPGDTPIGFSVQRGEDDDWDGPRAETRGEDNAPQPLIINELAVSTTGTDWEFVELFGQAGTSLDGYSLVQIGGSTAFNPGEVLSVIDFTGGVIGDNGFFLATSPGAEATFPVTGDLNFADNTFTNGASTFLLVEGFTGAEGDDLDADDDGTLDSPPFTAVQDEVALTDASSPILYSDVVVGPDGTFLAAGAQRSEDGGGEFVITEFGSSTGYTPTAGGTGTGTGGTPVLISEIQGAGDTSALVGQQVQVTAIVTYVDENGYFLQEEDADADGNAATSEGIFVFTGASGLGTIAIGQQVTIEGTVDEFGGETQISGVTSTTLIASDQEMPTAASVLISPDTTQADYEAVEGMRVSVTSGTSEALTVIENFELARYGQVAISAGTQTQPTQLFDAQTEAAAIEELMEDNANNRLILEDGVSAQNPDGFEYIPAAQGDNGNGYLDAGDTFTAEGPTLRLGTQIVEAVEGVMTFTSNGFGAPAEFQVIVQEQLVLDESTNADARPDTPDDVGGDIQVASANVLNFFTTLDDGSGGGSGPDDLEPRGATSASDLERQTDALVDMLLGTGAEVLALQELENNGFGTTSAIATLVAALNAEASLRGLSANFEFVDPTGGDPDGFIGTDAITTGIIFDANAVTPVYADYLEFEEASAADTFALADVLNQVASSDDQLGDFQRSRPAVAATFVDNTTGDTFTVVSNHFKSKGDSNLEDVVADAVAALAGGSTAITQADIDAVLADPNYDQGNGQGFWNAVRTDAANELSAWLPGAYLAAAQAANPGLALGEDFLVLGDFNAYAEEDPTQAFRDQTADYIDLIDSFLPGGQDEAFSFIFDGQGGTLDQAFGSTSLAGNITGVTEWHINAQEPGLLNYSSEFTNPAFFEDGVFAASDHDPLIIGLDLDDPLAVV
ncbi:ExeM/NucH family extracellular endonuclease [Algicella marina]|uniref:ExeM/NucH family extracellular endonuclease n=1 Tax=Algicella marina TaxID=2683284 RepID=A0A6P1T4R9_9RHOB|nr:ExeM/NucH family extracellular endonuclease [Algicella marina]QHQ36486.1 ExeM/NucH family extracellular endonuclease [Algicella marina]